MVKRKSPPTPALAAASPYTYLAIGQDLESIQSYLDDVDSDTPPHAYLVYTDLQTLVGLTTPVNYGSGIEYASGVLQLSQQYFPNSRPSLQIGLWLNGTDGCRDILDQQYPGRVEELFRFCMVDCNQVAKIYLRIGYEFDNPDFRYSSDPDIYRRTFQYLVEECERLYSSPVCHGKIEFVWHSWAATTYTKSSSPSLNDYYPGDAYVDWIGISIFSQLYTEETRPRNVTALGTPDTVRYICDFARHHDKRILIAESTPFGGLDQLHDPWSDWFVPVLELIEEYSATIHMWSYIYCNWNVQPMWRMAGFGDSRLSQNATLLRLWHNEVLLNPQFSPSVRKDVPKSFGLLHMEPPEKYVEVELMGSSSSPFHPCFIILALFAGLVVLQNVMLRWNGRKLTTEKPCCSPFSKQEALLSRTKTSMNNYGTVATDDKSER
jgi:Glycosyl hydrolase family 26